MCVQYEINPPTSFRIPRSAQETKCGQESGILKVIMADGRPFKWVKFDKPQKPHIHPLRDVHVQN